MQIAVDPFRIAGDTIEFGWTQSRPTPIRTRNGFFVRYEGLDLARFSPQLFAEIFLGYTLKVFAGYGEPVELRLPVAVPRPVVDFWRAYNDADRVTVGPVTEDEGYDPWARGESARGPRGSAAVFFGGGKDSMLTASLLRELRGPERVVLIQFVAPLMPSPDLAVRLEQRQHKLMLEPAHASLGVATQRVFTDYQATFAPEEANRRPHLELYTLGSLPVMLDRGVDFASLSAPWSNHPIHLRPNGAVQFVYRRSRPETLAAQSAHHRRVLGRELIITNLNLVFSEFSTVAILAERYPEAYRHIVMCTNGRPRQRWCFRCMKCGTYALNGLALGLVDERFDYDRLFAVSNYVRALVAIAESGEELDADGNAPYHDILCAESSFRGMAHAIARVDPALIADRLSEEAFTNLMTIISLYGNRTFPVVDGYAPESVPWIAGEEARRVAAIAGEHLQRVDALPREWMDGGEPCQTMFTLRMVPPGDPSGKRWSAIPPG